MLIALTTACRSSELRALNPELLVDKGSEIEFPIAVLTKGRRPSKPHFSIVLKSFDIDACLDVVSCLRVYLQQTKDWRTTGDKKSQLFLSFIDEHKTLAVATLAGWLKTTMAEAGIDTSIFKAHSTRSASTSKARALGLAVEHIVKQGNWSKAQTFHKHYHKQVIIEGFQTMVLKKE